MVILVILILFLLVLVFRALAVKGRPLEEKRHHTTQAQAADYAACKHYGPLYGKR